MYVLEIWQEFINKVNENIPDRDRYKIIMDDVMAFLRRDQHFEDLTNLSKH